MIKLFKTRKWKQVRPGLWERPDTPKTVILSSATSEEYKEATKDESERLAPLLKEILETEK